MQFIAQYFPILLEMHDAPVFQGTGKPWLLKNMLKQLPEIDVRIFEDMHLRNAMIIALREAFRQNAAVVRDDFRLAMKASSLSLEEIQCPLVVWHGGKDSQVPIKYAEIYAQKMSAAEYHFLKEEGHISILHNHAEDILASAQGL